MKDLYDLDLRLSLFDPSLLQFCLISIKLFEGKTSRREDKAQDTPKAGED